MSTLRANIIDSAVSTEFKDTVTANGDKQWVDSYGVIKTKSCYNKRKRHDTFRYKRIIHRACFN